MITDYIQEFVIKIGNKYLKLSSLDSINFISDIDFISELNGYLSTCNQDIIIYVGEYNTN